MGMLRSAFLLPLFLLLPACTTTVKTNPERSATEQMLISTAAERAASQLAIQIPSGMRVYIDNSFFEGGISSDTKYAIAAIRSHVLGQGASLTDEKKDADIIIETRAGALSTDQKTSLVGLPELHLPLPLSSAPLAIPQIALYADEEQKSTAKFAMIAYNAKDGRLIAKQEPKYGFAHNTQRTLLIFISWTDSDYMPKDADSDVANGRQDAKEKALPTEVNTLLDKIKTD
ncbi:MAG: DUF6655 family protein [Rickettsiales bacterium]